jgi:hypothetical protein
VYRILFILLLLIPFRGASEVYPLQIIQGYIFTEAVIEGEHVLVILDTGAPGLVLNQKYYTADPESSMECTGINGNFEGKSRLVSKWTWLGITAKNSTAIVSDLSFLEHSLRREVRALMGLSALSHFYVSIDYDAQTIRLEKEMAEIPEGSFFKFQYADHLPMITCKVNGEKKTLGIDSGSECNFLFNYQQPSGQELLANASQVMVVGTDNKKDIRHRMIMPLEVNDSQIATSSEFIVDLKDERRFQHADFDGMLGQTFLSQYSIIIHPGKQKIMLIPREASSQLASAIMP